MRPPRLAPPNLPISPSRRPACGPLAAPDQCQASSGRVEAPTLASSHATIGLAARRTSTTLVLALAVASQGATGHSFQQISPLYRSSSILGWSLGYPFGAVFSDSWAVTSTPARSTVPISSSSLEH